MEMKVCTTLVGKQNTNCFYQLYGCYKGNLPCRQLQKLRFSQIKSRIVGRASFIYAAEK